MPPCAGSGAWSGPGLTAWPVASTQELKGAARAQVAVEAETLSSAPGLRRRVLGELLQHLLDGFADAVPGHLEGAAAAARPAAWLANLQG